MKIIDVSTRRPVTIVMFTLAVLLFGTVSLLRLKINLLPSLTYPTLTVRTEYPGAAPAEIENLISKPIEEALGVVKNVNRVSSISRSGQSDVVLEFAWGTNMDYAGLDVREKLDILELPLEVRRPSILRFDPSLDPVMRFGLCRKAGGPFDAERLKFLRRLAEEEVKKELEAALGVAAVKVSGGLEDEIQVLIDQARMAQIQLPLEDLAAQLASENVNLSGGRLEEGTQQYLVRTLGQFRSIEEIADIIVASRGGAPVRLRDVAEIREGFKDREAITRLNGTEAVEVAIYKEGDANTVSVARDVEKRLARVYRTLPRDVSLVKVYDQSTFIRQAVSEVIWAAIVGGLLAVVILYFFLRNLWATVIISLSIPVSVVATFNLMYGADLTLNIMSLGGIALGIGMLVDNSIVVLENISRHRGMGKEILNAARDGAGEVGRVVAASTLTTVAVFFPLVFVKGISGQMFRDQALTVTFSLMASLVVALTLIPMLASRQVARPVLNDPSDPASAAGARKSGRLRRILSVFSTRVPVFSIKTLGRVYGGLSRGLTFVLGPALNGFDRLYGGLETQYPRALAWALVHKRTVIGVALVLFAGSVALIPVLGVELIPQLSQGEFKVEFRLPPGTPLQATDAAVEAVRSRAGTVERITTCFSVAGTGNRMDANPEQGGENWGELSVTMARGSKRRDEEEAVAALRRNLEAMPAVDYKFSRPTLFSFRTPVEIEVAGFDLGHLKQTSGEIARRLEASPRFADVKSTMEAGHPEIQIGFDRDRAAALGLPVYRIAERIVDKVRGDVATRYSWHDRKIDVVVRAREEDRSSVERIRNLIINPESDRPITLGAIAEITVDTGPGEIRRIHQERVALVTANLRYGDLGEAASEITEVLRGVSMPSGVAARLAGQSEEMATSFRSLIFALLLAVFLVYLVMASQFESFLHPFVIMMTMPLAAVGAVFALLVARAAVSVVVFLGAILLAGIVVNNAIVLVDFINQLRARGVKKAKAIVEAGRLRLRPIMMTTVTTVLGLLPLALGFGEGAEIRSPMAITVIGGLTVSTLLTLVVIPVVYSVLDRGE